MVRSDIYVIFILTKNADFYGVFTLYKLDIDLSDCYFQLPQYHGQKSEIFQKKNKRYDTVLRYFQSWNIFLSKAK